MKDRLEYLEKRNDDLEKQVSLLRMQLANRDRFQNRRLVPDEEKNYFGLVGSWHCAHLKKMLGEIGFVKFGEMNNCVLCDHVAQIYNIFVKNPTFDNYFEAYSWLYTLKKILDPMAFDFFSEQQKLLHLDIVCFEFRGVEYKIESLLENYIVETTPFIDPNDDYCEDRVKRMFKGVNYLCASRDGETVIQYEYKALICQEKFKEKGLNGIAVELQEKLNLSSMGEFEPDFRLQVTNVEKELDEDLITKFKETQKIYFERIYGGSGRA